MGIIGMNDRYTTRLRSGTFSRVSAPPVKRNPKTTSNQTVANISAHKAVVVSRALIVAAKAK
jgi:hypothetical protein